MHNFKTVRALLVAVFGLTLSALASAQPGNLWGISLNGFNDGSPGPSSLYRIDAVTGAGTLIGTNMGYSGKLINFREISLPQR